MFITKLVEKYNLKKRYIYLTQVSEADLVQFYQSAYLFVFPSLFEWFGRPPLEAQACWCPVISTHSGALWEVLWGSAYSIDNPIDIPARQHAIKEMENKQTREKVREQWIQNAHQFTKASLYKKRQQLLEKIVSS